MRLQATGLGLFAVWVVSFEANGQGTTPLLKLACTPQNFPSCGLSPVDVDQFHTRTLLPGGGPQGQNAVEFDMVQTNTPSQFYFGWAGNSGVAANAGDTRYARFRIKVTSPLRPEGNGDYWGTKFIIVGDGADSSSRVICNLVPDVGGLAFQCARNIDGEPSRTARVLLPNDVWHSVQVEARSSRPGQSDAMLSVWLDEANSNYASPTTRSAGPYVQNVGNWQNANIGFYAGASVAVGSRVNFHVTDFEYDDEYDERWHAPVRRRIPAPPAALAVRP